MPRGTDNFRTILDNNVKIKVIEGIATLTGTVPDIDDNALAADTGENLSGVVSVKNEIKLESPYPVHSDAWMAFNTRSRLRVKGSFSATSTKVAVTDGVVTLSGPADNVAQKELTAAYAKDIDGVKSAANDMTVLQKPAMSQTLGGDR